MKLWFWWVLATTVAFGVGGRAGAALSPSNDIIVIGYLSVTACLVLAGALQWLTPRRLIANTDGWVPMSVAAAAIDGLRSRSRSRGFVPERRTESA